MRLVRFIKTIFLGLPDELEEAAYLEGANIWTIFSKLCCRLLNQDWLHLEYSQRCLHLKI